MRIFCWNVNSLVPTVRNINLKYGSLARFFQELDADIVCLQEVKLPYVKLTKDLVVVEGYQSYWSCSEGKTGYSGVTTWARQQCAAVSAEADPLNCDGCTKEGRCVVTDHGSIVLFNVYVPNAGDRPERARLSAKVAFLRALKDKIDVLAGSGRQVIAVGDFNVASEQRDVHSAINWETLYEQQELDALHALYESCTDTWRHLHPTDEGVYTVWNEKTSARAFNVGLRIDYALCSKGLLPHIKSCEILLDLPPKWSDHAPVMLELDLPADAASATTCETSQQQVACHMWQQLVKQFADPKQRSIAAMFRAAGTSKPQQRRTTAGHSSKSVAVAAEQATTVAPALPQAEILLDAVRIGQESQVVGSSLGSKRSCQHLTEPHSAAAEGTVAKQAKRQAAHPVAWQLDADVQDADPGREQEDVLAAAQPQDVQLKQQQQSQQPEQLSNQPSVVASQQREPAEDARPVSRSSEQSRKRREDSSRGPRQAKLQSFFTAGARLM